MTSTDPIAFVLSGGATHGAVQVGMLRALLQAGIAPDLLVGTSVGAMNAAMFSTDPTESGLEELARLWIVAPRSEIFPLRPVATLSHLRSRPGHLFPNAGLRRWIESNLRYQRLEEFPIPLHVMATDVATNAPVRLSRGDALSAILASASLPGAFPPIVRAGRLLADGGIVADVPIAPARLLGARRIFVLSPRTTSGDERGRSWRPARRSNAALLSLLDRWFGQGAGASPASIAGAMGSDHGGDAEVIWLPSPYVGDVSPFSFRYSRRLIDESYQLATTWLAAGRGIGTAAERIEARSGRTTRRGTQGSPTEGNDGDQRTPG